MLLMYTDQSDGSISLLVMAFCLYFLHPALSLVLPYWLTFSHDLPSLLSFFQTGIVLLLFSSDPNGTTVGLVCLLIGMFSASYGAEKRKRQQRRNNRA